MPTMGRDETGMIGAVYRRQSPEVGRMGVARIKILTERLQCVLPRIFQNKVVLAFVGVCSKMEA